jgi:hypothetical protein
MSMGSTAQYVKDAQVNLANKVPWQEKLAY